MSGQILKIRTFEGNGRTLEASTTSVARNDKGKIEDMKMKR